MASQLGHENDPFNTNPGTRSQSLFMHPWWNRSLMQNWEQAAWQGHSPHHHSALFRCHLSESGKRRPRANTAWFMTCPIPMTGHRSTPLFHSSRKLSSIVPWVVPSGNYCNCPKAPLLQNAIWRMPTAWFLSTHPSIPSWEYTSRDSITKTSVWQWAVEVHAKSSKHLQWPYIISTSSTTQTQATFTCLTTR